MFIQFKWDSGELNYVRVKCVSLMLYFPVVFLCCVTSKESKGVLCVYGYGVWSKGETLNKSWSFPSLSILRWFLKKFRVFPFFVDQNSKYCCQKQKQRAVLFYPYFSTGELIIYLWAGAPVVGWDRCKDALESEGWKYLKCWKTSHNSFPAVQEGPKSYNNQT